MTKETLGLISSPKDGESPVHGGRDAKELYIVIDDLLVLAAAGGFALKMLTDILPESAKKVEIASTELTDQFRTLAQNSQMQSETVHSLIGTIGKIPLEDKEITIDEFIHLFSKTLDDSVDKILRVSKQALSIVYNMDDAITNLKEIENFSKQIQKITHQSNLLALNALIEAGHAGEAGKGFRVVAHEVKELSSEIAMLSDNMGVRTQVIMKNMLDGYDVLKDVATTDMNDHLLAKDTLEMLLVGLVKQRDESVLVMQEAARSSQEISKVIRGMIIELQFQDRNTQVIDNCSKIINQFLNMLGQIEDELRKLIIEGTDTSNDLNIQDAVDKILATITLGDLRTRYLKLLETSGRPLASDQVAHSSQQSPAMDDIELF